MSIRYQLVHAGRPVTFAHRAAAVIYDPARDRVLIHRDPRDMVWALPGGAVTFGEDTAQAVVRELQEEIGATVRADRLLWIAETFFHAPDGTVSCHELGWYYLCFLPDDHPYLRVDALDGFEAESGYARTLEFIWVARAAAPISPRFLVEAFRQGWPTAPLHLIHHQPEDIPQQPSPTG